MESGQFEKGVNDSSCVTLTKIISYHSNLTVFAPVFQNSLKNFSRFWQPLLKNTYLMLRLQIFKPFIALSQDTSSASGRLMKQPVVMSSC